MITRIPGVRTPITLVVMASATLLCANYAAAQDEGRKSQLSSMTVVGSDADGTFEDGTLVKVRYHDLNIKTDAGLTALYHRIKVAAHLVCYQSLPVWVPQRNSRLQQCQDTAVDAAVVQIGNARLAALHRDDTNSKSGG
jgi:UrcA family protein